MKEKVNRIMTNVQIAHYTQSQGGNKLYLAAMGPLLNKDIRKKFPSQVDVLNGQRGFVVCLKKSDGLNFSCLKSAGVNDLYVGDTQGKLLVVYFRVETAILAIEDIGYLSWKAKINRAIQVYDIIIKPYTIPQKKAVSATTVV